MGDTNGAKYKHFLYNLNWAKKKSRNKYKKAIEWYILILRKEDQGMNPKWVVKTKAKAVARLKKYGVTDTQVKERLEAKGLKKLEKLMP